MGVLPTVLNGRACDDVCLMQLSNVFLELDKVDNPPMSRPSPNTASKIGAMANIETLKVK